MMIIMVCLFSGTGLLAQNKDEPVGSRPFHDININLAGDASIISINYERSFFICPAFFVAGNIGLGYNEEFKIFRTYSTPEEYVTISHYLTGNIGKRRSCLELGIGGTFISGSTDQYYILYPVVGYRLQPLKSGRLNFRANFQFPLKEIEDVFFSPLGLSLGICF